MAKLAEFSSQGGTRWKKSASYYQIFNFPRDGDNWMRYWICISLNYRGVVMLSTAEGAGIADASGIDRLTSDYIDSGIHGQTGRDLLLWCQFFCKRAIDIFVSASALIVLLPLLVIVMIAIRAESQGSPIFMQLRWGRNNSKIRVFKFRSMRSDLCDPSGVAQTVAGDARITKVGAFLRKSNLDELPQLWNVLRGDMSLVGPRCHAIGMLAAGVEYERLVPRYHERHMVRPGLTGLAQMRGLRGPTDRPAKARARVAADLFYIENFSILLDLRIIWGTVVSELRGGNGF